MAVPGQGHPVQLQHCRLRERLLFDTPARDFLATSAATRAELEAEFALAPPARQAELESVVAELAIDLSSYLPRWHLLVPELASVIDADQVARDAVAYRELLRRWGAHERRDAVASEVASIARSNLRRLSELADQGLIACRWGHDSASGLSWALRRGAVLATTNPVMVNTVRREDPAAWDPVRDALKALHPDATPEQRASFMTMRVVLEELRELRPIWRASAGRYGNVSLQVDPRANTDAGRMVEEVQDLDQRLSDELGGTPNARFKVPGTRAGLEAVRRITAQGIGVTVTVSASVDQLLAFAEVIEQGSAPPSNIVLMMGRLDDPVRAELETSDVTNAADASRWASVAVLRRSYPLLFEERGYRRSVLMAASMRGPWTIEGAIVEGPSEVAITCFPDKAREFDAAPRELVSHVRDPLPSGVEARLMQSRIFRDAYEVGALPVEAFDSFAPVVQTLDQFSRSYEEFLEYNA